MCTMRIVFALILCVMACASSRACSTAAVDAAPRVSPTPCQISSGVASSQRADQPATASKTTWPEGDTIRGAFGGDKTRETFRVNRASAEVAETRAGQKPSVDGRRRRGGTLACFTDEEAHVAPNDQAPNDRIAKVRCVCVVVERGVGSRKAALIRRTA
jgi:hypothetical protein